MTRCHAAKPGENFVHTNRLERKVPRIQTVTQIECFRILKAKQFALRAPVELRRNTELHDHEYLIPHQMRLAQYVTCLPGLALPKAIRKGNARTSHAGEEQWMVLDDVTIWSDEPHVGQYMP